jgi:hypothetical protein
VKRIERWKPPDVLQSKSAGMQGGPLGPKIVTPPPGHSSRVLACSLSLRLNILTVIVASFNSHFLQSLTPLPDCGSLLFRFVCSQASLGIPRLSINSINSASYTTIRRPVKHQLMAEENHPRRRIYNYSS